MLHPILFTIPEKLVNTNVDNDAIRKPGRTIGKQYIGLDISQDGQGILFANDFKTYDVIPWSRIQIDGMWQNQPIDWDNNDYQALRKEILRVEEKFDLFASNVNSTKVDYDLILNLQKEVGILKQMMVDRSAQPKPGVKK